MGLRLDVGKLWCKKPLVPRMSGRYPFPQKVLDETFEDVKKLRAYGFSWTQIANGYGTDVDGLKRMGLYFEFEEENRNDSKKEQSGSKRQGVSQSIDEERSGETS